MNDKLEYLIHTLAVKRIALTTMHDEAAIATDEEYPYPAVAVLWNFSSGAPRVEIAQDLSKYL